MLFRSLVNYMSQILVELVKLANLIINVTKAIACGNRIQNVMELKPGIVSGTAGSVEAGAERAAKPEGADGKIDIQKQTVSTEKSVSEHAQMPKVEFSHVSFRYKNAGADSLTDISFRVEKGQTIGIIGGTEIGRAHV